MEKKIRVLVAHDHGLVRYALCTLCAAEPDMEVIGEAMDGVEAVKRAQSTAVDVVMLGLSMPGKRGVDIIKEVKQARAAVQFVVVPSSVDGNETLAARREGALGYLHRTAIPESVAEAIRTVHRGETYPRLGLTSVPTAETRVSWSLASAHPCHVPALTTREITTLRLMAQGLSNTEIADKLTVSQRTVGIYVSSVLKKLHLTNRTQAALYALREGWAKLAD